MTSLDLLSRYPTSISLVTMGQTNFCKRDFVIDHKFSMGLRSGEFPSQSSTFILCYLKTVFIFLDERHGARSRRNILSPSGSAFLIPGMTFLSITSMYLSEFIIPSIRISEPIYENLKLPQK